MNLAKQKFIPVLTLVALLGCASPRVIPPTPKCAPELTDVKILAAAQRWLTVVLPGARIAELSPLIRRDDNSCDYFVILHRSGLAAIEDVVIAIDRDGHVLNIPECCQLNDCPQFCKRN